MTRPARRVSQEGSRSRTGAGSQKFQALLAAVAGACLLGGAPAAGPGGTAAPRLPLAALAAPMAATAPAITAESCPRVSLDIFLLVDASGSMAGTWDALADAFDLFAADLGPDDRVVLATFSHLGTYQVAARVDGDRVAEVTSILRSIDVERPQGTDLLGSLRRAAPEIHSRGGGVMGGMARVPILLVLTDGQDTNEETVGVLVETGRLVGESPTDQEGADVARLYTVTQETLQGWADLWAEALAGPEGEFPLTMVALFDHPIPDDTGRPIPGTGRVRPHFEEMARLRPELNLHLVDLERGMRLPIGVVCAVPSLLDFGNVPATLSEPREVRFVVRGRSGAVRLPTPGEVRLTFLGDPAMLRGGAGAVMEAEPGSAPGSLAVRLRLVNPDNLAPAVYEGGSVALSLPERTDEMVFLVPDRLGVRFRTDLEPRECSIAATGPAGVSMAGPGARQWQAERLLVPDCAEAVGSEGLLTRVEGLPAGASVVVEDGFGQEVARLTSESPNGRLPGLGDLTASLVWGGERHRGAVRLTMSASAANVVYRVSGEGIEVGREGAVLVWHVENRPPLPWWVWALVGAALLWAALAQRATFPARARLVFAAGGSARPARAAGHPLLFGPATCVLQARDGGGGALRPPGSRGVAVLRATRAGATVSFRQDATRDDGRPLKRGQPHPLVEGVGYEVAGLRFGWEGGRRRRRR